MGIACSYDWYLDLDIIVMSLRYLHWLLQLCLRKTYSYIIHWFCKDFWLVCFHRYDPETNRWTFVAPMSVARLGAGVVMCGGSLYVVGGFDGDNRWNTVERFQPDTNTWQHVAPMNTVRSGLGKYFAPFIKLMNWNCFLLLDMLTTVMWCSAWILPLYKSD